MDIGRERGNAKGAGVPPAQRTANQSFRGSEATEESRKKERRCFATLNMTDCVAVCLGIRSKPRPLRSECRRHACTKNSQPVIQRKRSDRRIPQKARRCFATLNMTDCVAVCLGIHGKPWPLRSERRRHACTKNSQPIIQRERSDRRITQKSTEMFRYAQHDRLCCGLFGNTRLGRYGRNAGVTPAQNGNAGGAGVTPAIPAHQIRRKIKRPHEAVPPTPNKKRLGAPYGAPNRVMFRCCGRQARLRVVYFLTTFLPPMT